MANTQRIYYQGRTPTRKPALGGFSGLLKFWQSQWRWDSYAVTYVIAIRAVRNDDYVCIGTTISMVYYHGNSHKVGTIAAYSLIGLVAPSAKWFTAPIFNPHTPTANGVVIRPPTNRVSAGPNDSADHQKQKNDSNNALCLSAPYRLSGGRF